jgi:hypothetical protein
MSRELKNPFGAAAALVNQSVALDKAGRRDEAIASASEAALLFERVKAPNAIEAREWLRELQGGEAGED